MIFHEIKVKYERQTGEDNPRAAKEIYLIADAVSFTADTVTPPSAGFVMAKFTCLELSVPVAAPEGMPAIE